MHFLSLKKKHPSTQVIHYNSNQVYPSQSSSTINSLSSYNVQQVAYNSQIMGETLCLIVKNKHLEISRATVNAFCTDFVRNYLAGSKSLTGPILENLEEQQKISIHHRETTTGEVCKHHFAAKAPKIAISASIAAAVGDYSQFKDIIDNFFSYTYSKSITSHNTSSTHYYANDQYTVTGCYLFRNIHSKKNSLKTALMHGELEETKYETQCYLFTFKVAQAAKFLEKHLNM